MSLMASQPISLFVLKYKITVYLRLQEFISLFSCSVFFPLYLASTIAYFTWSPWDIKYEAHAFLKVTILTRRKDHAWSYQRLRWWRRSSICFRFFKLEPHRVSWSISLFNPCKMLLQTKWGFVFLESDSRSPLWKDLFLPLFLSSPFPSFNCL